MKHCGNGSLKNMQLFLKSFLYSVKQPYSYVKILILLSAG